MEVSALLSGRRFASSSRNHPACDSRPATPRFLRLWRAREDGVQQRVGAEPNDVGDGQARFRPRLLKRAARGGVLQTYTEQRNADNLCGGQRAACRADGLIDGGDL